jgi:hypothetical protein
MTQDRFMKVIAYVSAWYQSFKFDLADGDEPSFQFKVWYDAFKEFDGDTLAEYVKGYCRENVYAPQSPASILEYIRGKVVAQLGSSAEAWDLVYKTIHEMNYRLGKVEKRLVALGRPEVAKSYAEMQDRFYGLLKDDIPYVRKEFMEIYERNAKAHALRLIATNDMPRLENKETLRLSDGKK